MVDNAAVLLCEFAVFFFVKILIAAAVLQLSCALYNLFSGASGKRVGTTSASLPRDSLQPAAQRGLYYRSGTFSGVPRADLDVAVRIVFFATLINVPGTFIIFKLLTLAGQVSLANDNYVLPTACLALPMGIFVLAGLITCLLPTSFGKGLLVSLLSHLLAAILATVIVLIVLAFGLQDFIHFPLG